MEIINTAELFSATVQEVIGLAAFGQLGRSSRLVLVREDEEVTLSWGGVHMGRGVYEEWTMILVGDEPTQVPSSEFSEHSSCNSRTGAMYLLSAGTAVIRLSRGNTFVRYDDGIVFNDTYIVYASIPREEAELAMAAARTLLELRALEAGEEVPVLREVLPPRVRRSAEPDLGLNSSL